MCKLLKSFGLLLLALGLAGPSPSLAYDACDAYRGYAEKAASAEKIADGDYGRANIQYERALNRRDVSNLKLIRDIANIDSQITKILLTLGIEAISVLTNKLTCDDPDFAAFCASKKRGQFVALAKRYTSYIGQKSGATKKLYTNDSIYSKQSRRQYAIAYAAWVNLLRRHNTSIQSQKTISEIIDKTLKDGTKIKEERCPGEMPPLGFPCTLPADTALQDVLANPKLESYEKTLNVQQGCPYPPVIPPAVQPKGKDGCFSILGGLGEAVGLTFCSNKLMDNLNLVK